MARANPTTAGRCENCGAPIVPGLAGCDYCRHAYAGVAPGPRCVACDVVNVAGAMACGRCRIPLAKDCVFCGRASPLDAAACVHCREAFEGAAQRRQAREDAARHKRYMDLAGTGVQVAGGLIQSGAAAGLLNAIANLVDDD